MTDEHAQELMNTNFRLLMLLGMITPTLIDLKSLLPKKDHYKIDYFLEAINNVVYLKKPLPPFPEKELL